MSRPKRYIEEKKVLDTIRYWWKTAILANGQPTLCDEIRALPTADVKPVVHGKWEKGYSFPDGEYVKCTVCGEIIKCIYPMHYCPNCGADMRGAENERN